MGSKLTDAQIALIGFDHDHDNDVSLEAAKKCAQHLLDMRQWDGESCIRFYGPRRLADMLEEGYTLTLGKDWDYDYFDAKDLLYWYAYRLQHCGKDDPRTQETRVILNLLGFEKTRLDAIAEEALSSEEVP
jgi:hypothetical protein